MIPYNYLLQIKPETLLALSLFLSILITVRAIYFRKKTVTQKMKLKSTAASLNKVELELEKLRQIEAKTNSFQNDLNRAELTTRLQKPRLAHEHQHLNCTAPERYQYIHSLTEKGMSSSDIASILCISPQEARQLVTLANLAKNNTE